MTATITLTWKHDGAKPTEFRIYRSDAPMDPDDMPEPIGTALPAEREYVNDDSIVEDNTYYYRVGALIGSAERISDELEFIALPAITDPPWDHVIALLHFDETSGATKLIDQSRYGRVWTPTNAATSDSVVLVDGNCLSLAGPATPSWLETSKSGLTIGSSDWTIEAAIRIAALPGAGKLYGILGTGNKDSPYYSMRFFISDSGEIGVTLSSDGAATTIIKSAASAISTDTTYRVCAERDDSTVRVYVDGIVVATGSYSSSVYLSSGSPNMYIGRLLDQSDIAENQGIFAGKIDEFRWVIGTAIYHGITYTPSAYPFPDVRNATPDPYWSDTKALLHFDSDYTDVASGSWSEDGGSLSISGSTYVYGGGALRVPSGTSRLKRSGLSIGSGAFTVEARARADSLSTSFIIFDCRNAHEDSSGFVVALRSTGKLLFGTGSPFAATEGTTVLTADTWYRVMVTRSVNGVVRLFLDGNLEAQVTASDNMSRANWYVGRTVDSSGSAGYIDELRITVGAARTPDNWTTAAAFPHGS